jgi:branched-chain amino acid transport system permease protein
MVLRLRAAARGFAIAMFAALPAIFAVGPPIAHADGSAQIDHQAWAQKGPIPIVGARNRTYVGAAAGTERARAFLHFELGGARAADISGATLELMPSGDVGDVGNPSLAACALATPLTADGDVSASPPSTDCTVRTQLDAGPNGSWSLSLAPFADRLASDGNGIAIVPDIAGQSTASFTVSFDTTKTALGGIPVAGVEPSTTSDTSVGATVPEAAPATPTPTVELPATPTPTPTVASPIAPVPKPQVRRGASSVQTPSTARRSLGPSPLVVVVAVGLLGLLLLPFTRSVGADRGAARQRARATSVTQLVAVAVAVGAISLLGEAPTFKIGLVGIVFIAAIGLHILINWAGELSLAHAAFIGVPAFLVAQVSAHGRVSPILLLPVGAVFGAIFGLVAALPARRAKGLQVALVTLAIGIAVDQFLFLRTWVVGPPNGLSIPTPSLLGVRFETNRSLLPVLAVVVGLAYVVTSALLRSKIGRAFAYVRSNEAAASAVGIPVAVYRTAAYSIAGAFGGLAGSTYVMWVQRVSPRAFPLSLGFTYLVIAVLAGKGDLIGLVVAVVALEGGRVFNVLPHGVALYIGPVAVIYTMTRQPAGLNGGLKKLTQSLHKRNTDRWRLPMLKQPKNLPPISISMFLGVLSIAAGFGTIALAWDHISRTNQLWVQNQEILSGGLAGVGMIIVGSALLVRDGLVRRVSIDEQSKALVTGNDVEIDGAIESVSAETALGAEAAPGELATTNGGTSRTGTRRRLQA